MSLVSEFLFKGSTNLRSNYFKIKFELSYGFYSNTHFVLFYTFGINLAIGYYLSVRSRLINNNFL